MKIINQDQINAVLQAIYQTNISVSTFDAIKKLFNELPNETKQENKSVNGEGEGVVA